MCVPMHTRVCCIKTNGNLQAFNTVLFVFVFFFFLNLLCVPLNTKYFWSSFNIYFITYTSVFMHCLLIVGQSAKAERGIPFPEYMPEGCQQFKKLSLKIATTSVPQHRPQLRGGPLTSDCFRLTPTANYSSYQNSKFIPPVLQQSTSPSFTSPHSLIYHGGKTEKPRHWQ